MPSITLTPSRVWKRMTLDQRLSAARAFWLDDQGADDQMQAVVLIAQQKKFRPKSVIALDVDRKARHLATLAALPDALAAKALVAYHLAEQRPMMAAFLDALGIAHEEGLITEEHVVPDPQKIGPAVEQIAQQYPTGSVSLYLNTLLSQDPDTWNGLATVPQREAI
jgi:hypothetical protein